MTDFMEMTVLTVKDDIADYFSEALFCQPYSKSVDMFLNNKS